MKDDSQRRTMEILEKLSESISSRQENNELQTAVPEKKSRPQKPRQLYVGLDRKLEDNRPRASPPSEEDEDTDNSYE